MQITITQVEYEAISFAISQIRTEIEGASNEVFIKDACNYQSALYRIVEKYRKARYKAIEFQEVRAMVAEKNRNLCLGARDVDKIARSLLKTIRKENNQNSLKWK